MLFLLTITEPLATGRRKHVVNRFAVEGTSAAAALPTFKLTHYGQIYLVPGARVDVEESGEPVVRLA